MFIAKNHIFAAKIQQKFGMCKYFYKKKRAGTRFLAFHH